MRGRIFDLLIILFSAAFTATSTDEGACRLSGADGDDDCAEPALSLLQRHARFTSKNGAAPGTDDAVAEAQFHEVPVKDSVAAPAKTAHEVSMPWRAGAAADVLGPIAFSPGMSLLAVQSDVHVGVHSHLKTMAGLPMMVIYVLLPVAAIALVCILFCLMGGDRKAGDQDEQQQPLKAPQGAKLQRSPQAGSALPSGALPTQSSLASSTSSMTRDTQGLPSLVFSPISPSVQLPAEQQRKMPACLLFPTMAADVRMRSRSFNIYWGSLEAPWFVMDVKQGSVDHDTLELSEAHSGVNKLCATCDLITAESSSAVQEGSSLWLISNKQLKANTRGLAYRSAKDNSKVRNAVAAWGSTVPGVDTGDGWLKVGEWYLPMAVDGHATIVHTDAKDVPQFSGLQIKRADGTSFATFKPMSGGQYAVVRNGATVCYISIGTSSFLMEAKLPNGKRVAAVAREQVRVASGEMMLELCVEPQMDPVIMLIGCVAVLRQLPPHQDG